MAAGKGTRARNVEDYLKGLLGAIPRVKSAPKPDEAGESDEDDASVAALSRRKCFSSSFRSDATN